MLLEHTTRFAQLLAQDNASEWMNILFMVVLAVFWLVGGLVKAAGANRRNQQRKKKEASPQPRRVTWLDRLAQKAQDVQKAIEQQSGAAAQGARKGQSQGDQSRPGKPAAPPKGHIAVRTDRKGGPVLVYERQTTPPSRPAAQQTRRRPPQRPAPMPRQVTPSTPANSLRVSDQDDVLTRTTFKAAPQIHRPVPEMQVETPPIDYSEPESLRRAILHYEILGKPLAFRDPLERTTSF